MEPGQPSPIDHQDPTPDEPPVPESVPQPTRWIAKWPWAAWTGWQRTSVTTQLLTRGLLGLASITSALVLVLGFGPQAYRELFWRQLAYDQLRQIHPGNSLAYLKEQLGEPAFVKPAWTGTALTQHIFPRRDHLVLAVTNPSGEAVLVSVTSCDPGFAPSFRSPLGTEVQLQTRRLSEAERPTAPSAGWDDHRPLSYAPWSTGSSTAQLVEEGAAVSTASRGRAFYVGVNALCADLDTLGLGTHSWFGPLIEAPEHLRAARESIAANFYAETVDLDVRLAENGQLEVQDQGQWVPGLFASPFHFDVPINLSTRDGTRRF